MPRKSTTSLDEQTEEAELLKALQNNSLKPAQNASRLMKDAVVAAKSYMKKEARINIRLSEVDLSRLKRKAAEEGLPYQTLISSIIHKFVTGRLLSRG